MALDELKLNGVRLAWGSYKFVVDDLDIYGITELTFSDKLTRTLGYSAGLSHAPTAISPGKYEVEEAKLKLYADTAKLLRQRLAEKSGTSSYGNVAFSVVAQGFEDRVGSIDVRLNYCYYAGTSKTITEGPDLQMEEISVQPLEILRDGLSLFRPATR